MEKNNDMGKGITKEDVAKLMMSVIDVAVDLYPYDYKTDSEFVDMVMPVINEHDTMTENNTIVFDLPYNTLLRCIDDKHGMDRYLAKFRSKYDITRGIGPYYDNLVAEYSSPEILVLYGMFPCVVYITLYIHLDKDERPQRDKFVSTLNIPDMRIKTVSVKLRDLCTQQIVDIINKYVIANTNFDNNVMSKRNTFMTDNISDFFGVIESMCRNMNDDDLYRELYSAFSFLDIDEIKDSSIVITTDWPVL